MNIVRQFKLKKLNGELDYLHPIQRCVIKIFDDLYYINNSYRDKNDNIYFYFHNNFYYSDLVRLSIQDMGGLVLNVNFDLLMRDLFVPIVKVPVVYREHMLLYWDYEFDNTPCIPDSLKKSFNGSIYINIM